MVRVPWDDFLDWVDINAGFIMAFPGTWRVTTRLRAVPAKSLPKYLKASGTGVTFAPRHPKAFLLLVAVTDHVGRVRFERKGYIPESVEVFLRWQPKTKE